MYAPHAAASFTIASGLGVSLCTLGYSITARGELHSNFRITSTTLRNEGGCFFHTAQGESTGGALTKPPSTNDPLWNTPYPKYLKPGSIAKRSAFKIRLSSLLLLEMLNLVGERIRACTYSYATHLGSVAEKAPLLWS